MDNLATATSAEHETVATLTKSIATLTEQLKVKDICAKSQEAELKRLLGHRALPNPCSGWANKRLREKILQNQKLQLLLVTWLSGRIESYKCKLYQKGPGPQG
jgi:hypothetical protein